MSNRYELVVFDWDGTLIDSTEAIAVSMQRAASDLGLPVPTREQAKHVIGLGLRDALMHAIPAAAPDDFARLIERYRHHFFQQDESLVLFPGIRELLESLQARGVRMAIATGKSSIGLARALESARLAGFFAATRCADQTAPKPDPAMLHEILNELDASADSTLMIGDTTHDLTMAAAARVGAIGVTYGAHSVDSLAGCPSLALLDSVSEVAAWLARHV